ncbi:MAG: hypothetical protein GF331_15165 [Chitinivibrionales bacterium]|nr:hypothetical protein [Chitinivibrionales bacterium]
MKVLTHLLAIVVGAAAVFFLVQQRMARVAHERAVLELIHTKAIVEKRLEDQAAELTERLQAFADRVANDRDFAMKLIVDQEPSAPQVSEVASRYVAVMGADLLAVTDSTHTLLSCGHFPAAAGNSVADKAALLDTEPVFLYDNIKGEQVLTRQARVDLTIAETVSLSCLGGCIVDEQYLRELAPRENLRMLFRYGDTTIGADSIEAISEITDNTMIVNDTTYLATSLKLQHAGELEAPEIIILADRPPAPSLF